MANFTNLSGLRVGHLTLLFPVKDYEHGGKMYVCKCDCGGVITALSNNLLHGRTKSCGCQRYHSGEENGYYKHGLKNKHPKLYRTWKNMKRRCYTPSASRYDRYGGRGIYVCDEWKDNPVAFVEWSLSNGYSENLSIDRIDNDGPYSPENCRWATPKQQVLNTSKTSIYTYKGKAQPLVSWAEEIGVKPATLRARLQRHTFEEALTMPFGGIGAYAE
jgi:hypothetical protein